MQTNSRKCSPFQTKLSWTKLSQSSKNPIQTSNRNYSPSRQMASNLMQRLYSNRLQNFWSPDTSARPKRNC